MQTELRCECNDNWIVGFMHTMFDYRNVIYKQCQTCFYDMWQDAYIENMYFDLKEMNS